MMGSVGGRGGRGRSGIARVTWQSTFCQLCPWFGPLATGCQHRAGPDRVTTGAPSLHCTALDRCWRCRPVARRRADDSACPSAVLSTVEDKIVLSTVRNTWNLKLKLRIAQHFKAELVSRRRIEEGGREGQSESLDVTDLLDSRSLGDFEVLKEAEGGDADGGERDRGRLCT